MFHLQLIGGVAGQINAVTSAIGATIVDFDPDLASVLEIFDLGG